jgi:glycosyltransferase involved in cell wall biosynthesis
MNTPNSKFNIAIVTYPFSDVAGRQNLANLIQTLEPLSDKIIAITGNFPEYPTKIVRIIRLKGWQTEGKPLPFKMFAHVLADLQISFNLLKVFRHVDIVAFQIGARAYPLSALLSKLLRKKIVAFSFSSASKFAQVGKGQKAFRLVNILENFTFLLADQIAVESESIIKFSNMERYRSKISIYGAQYIDMNLFKVTKELKYRRELIGYIGRLVELKGITELVKAIPLILNKRNNAKFLIGGDGVLFDEIMEELKSNGVYSQVKLTGGIPHNEVPSYLNEMKLLILPSYTEGIPGIIQEAMACGAVVLATSVGGVPDLIKDGGTGFIMENNSREWIAKNAIRALEHPDLEGIVKNARKLIEDEYSYEVMVRKCKDSLDELMRGNR